MQTICSWIRIQGYSQLPVPTHRYHTLSFGPASWTQLTPFLPTREIQRMLVDMKDKQSSFVGSREWIGAIEIQMCLDKLYGVCMMLWWWSWWWLVSFSAAAHDSNFGANRRSCRARSCV